MIIFKKEECRLEVDSKEISERVVIYHEINGEKSIIIIEKCYAVYLNPLAVSYVSQSPCWLIEKIIFQNTEKTEIRLID